MIKIFVWSALYNNGEILSQIDVRNNEHLFKEIDQSRTTRFGISNDKQNIVVDLTNGRFYVNSIPMRIPNLSDRDEKYRLIYFRRVRKSIGTRPGMEGTETESFIGYQITINGVNKQATISVFDTDKIVFNIHIK